jgi:hypothetical protein
MNDNISDQSAFFDAVKRHSQTASSEADRTACTKTIMSIALKSPTIATRCAARKWMMDTHSVDVQAGGNAK